jgi:hypothetical protein
MKNAWLIAAVLVLLPPCLPDSFADWGAAYCAPVGVPESFAANGYEWRANGDHHLLFRNGVQVGGWREREQEYRSYDAATNRWSDPQPAPWVASTAADPFGSLPSIPPTGLIPEMLSATPTVWYGQVSHPAEEVQGNDQVPDLHNLPYVTVVSADAGQREQIVREIKSSALGKSVRVQGLPPEHWLLEGFKLPQDQAFKQSGLAVFVQAPPEKPGGFGKVLDPEYTWSGVEALGRKIDPAYNPNRNVGGAGDAGTILIILGCIAAACFLWPRREDGPQPAMEGVDV